MRTMNHDTCSSKLEKRDRNLASSYVGFHICSSKVSIPFLFLFSPTGLHGEDQVEQKPQTLELQAGHSGSFTCSYKVSRFGALSWYRQAPGKGPKLLFILYSKRDEKHNGGLRATLSSDASFVYIAASTPEDAATYFCAVDAQCSADTFSSFQNPAAGAPEKGHSHL